MSVTAKGASELAADLQLAADGLRSGMADVNAEIARAIVANVRPPVLSGALARTITPESDATTATVTAGGPTVRYAGVQERRFRYLSRALEATAGQAVDLIGRGVAGELARVGG